MHRQDKALKLIEVFIVCDDFFNALIHWQTQQGQPLTYRSGQLTDSEMVAITVRATLHFLPLLRSQMLEYYYRNCVEMQLGSYFPQLITYERFVARMTRLLPGLFILLKWQCSQAKRTGFFIADSKPLAVCDNHHIKSNKVFAGLAARGKLSMTVRRYGLVLRFKGPFGH